MTVRTLLSARGAAPRVEVWVGALVRCSAFLARAAPGAELPRLASALSERVEAAAGEAHAGRLASPAQLEARLQEALEGLEAIEPAAWLKALAGDLAGGFKRDALLVTYRVAAVDGALAPGPELAFRRLGAAFGLSPDEVLAVEAMARGTARAGRRGRDTAAIEGLERLWGQGWSRPFQALEAAGVVVPYDASAEYQGLLGRLRLDLDAAERVLHLHLLGQRGPGPHLICLYGARFPAVLGCVEAARDTLGPATVAPLLSELSPLCDALFVERDGRLVKV